MPFGFSHLIFAWFLGKSYEYIRKVNLYAAEFGFLMFGSVLPDADYLIDWTFNVHYHRLISHSFLGLFAGFVICFLFVKLYNKLFNKNLNARTLSLLLSIGILSHIFLDMMQGTPGTPLFFPWDEWFYFFGVVDTYRSIGFSDRAINILTNNLRWAIFDIGLGIAFIFYLMLRGKINKL